MRTAKPLDPGAIFRTHGARVLIGGEGEVLQSVASTMDVARERLLSGASDGYVVLAEHQTAGRARGGSWHCPSGRGILMSIALKLALPARQQKLVAIMGAVAATEAVRRFGIAAQVKWPNDVVVSSDEGERLRVKKIGGVLVERVERGEAAAVHVLGIGLNVNQSRAELPREAALKPTSMRIEGGQRFDRNAVCRAVLEEMNSWYRRLAMGQHERLLARWRQCSCLVGRAVEASVSGRVISGKVRGIRSTGELILEDAAGQRWLLSDQKARLVL